MNAKWFFEKAGGAIGRAILDFLFPICCVGCKKEKTHCCTECFNAIAPAAPVIETQNGDFAFEKIIAAAPHEEGSPIAKLIHRFKYDGAREIGMILAEFIKKEWRENIRLPQNSILAPVPLHSRRRLFRGFNQSEILAHEIGKIFGLRCENLLRRHIYTRPQVELGHKNRLKNIAGAFSPASPQCKCDPRAVYVLVDDVATTGATLNECAKVLKSAGAAKIMCIVVCRAIAKEPQCKKRMLNGKGL